MRIAVLGPGAIGGLISALLWKNGNEVFCIGTNHSVKKINSNGIQLYSKLYGDFTAKPIASETLQVEVDVLIIAVKAPNLLNAIQKIEINNIKNGIIVPLLNGTGFEQIIKDRFGEEITAAGTIGSIEAIMTNNTINHLSSSQPVLNTGSNKKNLKKKLINFANTLEEIGISRNVFDSEAECTWTKLIRLNAIATLTSAFQVNIGAIVNDPTKNSFLHNILQEGALVAEQDGVLFDVTKIKNQIYNLPPSLSSSMQRDIRDGASSEINYITGGVINLAKRYNIPVPAHLRAYKLLQGRVKEFESKHQ
ncbi:2-dehydropantoate 2-reductase [Gammaproteobacteria bacterium]|jgi:2-dehydropantoate 2-reductase|nr:2-dehydropantoate 2-reductase [Gammaproteobacteria bacterium]|tara:strand:- start:137 stop:1057 length:921 start_codon:yes stop_codon:yes gene_type:complete